MIVTDVIFSLLLCAMSTLNYSRRKEEKLEVTKYNTYLAPVCFVSNIMGHQGHLLIQKRDKNADQVQEHVPHTAELAVTDEVHVAINSLKDSCLLMHSDKSRDHVIMHKLVCDIAMTIV